MTTEAPIRGRATTYRGTHFRSRLEARWAAFFDLIDWRWTYEPLDADGYIPDFLVHGSAPLFVEVGPCIVEADYRTKSAKADERGSLLRHDVLVVGISPLADLTGCFNDQAAAGWLGEWMAEVAPADSRTEFAWGTAWWGWENHRDLNVWHDYMSYGYRPSGTADGDHHLRPVRARDMWRIHELWAEAGNATQWRGRR